MTTYEYNYSTNQWDLVSIVTYNIYDTMSVTYAE
jgi:hypothetical protein